MSINVAEVNEGDVLWSHGKSWPTQVDPSTVTKISSKRIYVEGNTKLSPAGSQGWRTAGFYFSKKDSHLIYASEVEAWEGAAQWYDNDAAALEGQAVRSRASAIKVRQRGKEPTIEQPKLDVKQL